MGTNQKYKKSMISLLLVLVLVVSLSTSVFAISDYIQTDKTTVYPGESFTVTHNEDVNYKEYFDSVSINAGVTAHTGFTATFEDFTEYYADEMGSTPTTDFTYTVSIFGPPSWDDEDGSLLDSIDIVFKIDSETSDSSTPRIPQKRDPITVNTHTQTNDLSYLVAIPEQWMDTTSLVEFWLDADAVSSSSEGMAYIASAQSILKSVGSTLLDTYQVDLMQRVTSNDGTTSEARVVQDYVRGNFTVRLPIPVHLAAVENLGIVYIEAETGLTANLASKIVLIDGVSYIEFENNRSAVYGFVSDPTNAAKK